MKRRNFFKVTLILVLITCIMSGCSNVNIIVPEVTSTPALQEQGTAEPTATPDETLKKTENSVPTDSPNSIAIDTQTQTIEEGSYGYYYNQLTREQKVIYCSIFSYYGEIKQEYVKFIGVNEKDILRSIGAINCDQPFLGVKEYTSYQEDDNSVSIMITSFKRKLSTQQEKKVEEKVKKILGKITGTEEEVIRKIYNWCTKNIKYDKTISKKHIDDLYGALINKECVCEGYAVAFKYLCNKAGINCINVEREKRHMWNYVRIHQKWYCVDVTWGQVNTKQFLLEGKESLENKNHIPENFNQFTLPTLSEESAYPADNEVQKIKRYLKNNIEITTERMAGLEEKSEYDEGEYQLLYSIKEKAKEILSKIDKSVFCHYINTSEFSEDYNEMETLIKMLNEM